MKKNIIVIILGIAGLLCVFVLVKSCQPERKPKAKIAFVIDDWGYNRNYVDFVLELNRPITFSILPDLRYSREIAEKVLESKGLCDVILHLPLESKSNSAAERNTIRTDMPRQEAIDIMDKEIKSIPGAIGVSNHQGSKATADKDLMEIILADLKKRGLFFLDSLTTPRTLCKNIAKDIGLRYAKRDIFLDITDQTDTEHFDFYVRKQIQELIDTALENGHAIGIGHNKKVTLEAIRDFIPDIEKQGIKIVPLKELAE